MRKLGVLVLSLPLLAGACGEEVAPASGSLPSSSATAGQPQSLPETPPQTQAFPVPSKLPSRPPVPEGAYQEITVARLDAPNDALRAPSPGHAQVIFACDYEEWSPQYETNVGDSRMNPPGLHSRGDQVGDFLSAKTSNLAGRALGGHGDVVADDYYARSYTEDSWPERKLITAYEVQRASLTRANVLEARNQYALGCTARDVPTVLDAVHVSIYAPWDWKI